MSSPHKSPRIAGVVRQRSVDHDNDNANANGNGGGDDDMDDPEAIFARLMAGAKTSMLTEVRDEICGHNKAITELVDKKLESVMVKLESKIESKITGIGDNTKSYMEAMDARNGKRLDKHTKALEDLATKQEEQSLTNARILDKMVRIEEALASRDAQPTTTSSSSGSNTNSAPPGFSRPPGDPNSFNKTIIKINTQKNPVRKDAILPLIQQMCQDADLDDKEWELKGPGISKRYTINFLVEGVDPDTAAHRAIKVNGSLQNEDRTWREINVQTPAKDPEGNYIMERLYIGLDKSAKCRTLEQSTNHMFKIIKAKYSSLEVDKIKYDNGITIGWQFALMFHYSEDTKTVSIEWFDDIITQFKINKQELIELHDRRFRSSTSKN